MPGVSRIIVGENYFGRGWRQITCFFIASLGLTFVFLTSFGFFRRAYFDYDRIDFGMKQLW
jgi:hypothetical protein